MIQNVFGHTAHP